MSQQHAPARLDVGVVGAGRVGAVLGAALGRAGPGRGRGAGGGDRAMTGPGEGGAEDGARPTRAHHPDGQPGGIVLLRHVPFQSCQGYRTSCCGPR